ncbi:MAG TPA: hypothetical protein VIS77_09930 [Burkholderiales bacterium]
MGDAQGESVEGKPALEHPGAGQLIRQGEKIRLVGGKDVHLPGSHQVRGIRHGNLSQLGIPQRAQQGWDDGPARRHPDPDPRSIHLSHGLDDRTFGDEKAVLDAEVDRGETHRFLAIRVLRDKCDVPGTSVRVFDEKPGRLVDHRLVRHPYPAGEFPPERVSHAFQFARRGVPDDIRGAAEIERRAKPAGGCQRLAFFLRWHGLNACMARRQESAHFDHGLSRGARRVVLWRLLRTGIRLLARAACGAPDCKSIFGGACMCR